MTAFTSSVDFDPAPCHSKLKLEGPKGATIEIVLSRLDGARWSWRLSGPVPAGITRLHVGGDNWYGLGNCGLIGPTGLLCPTGSTFTINVETDCAVVGISESVAALLRSAYKGDSLDSMSTWSKCADAALPNADDKLRKTLQWIIRDAAIHDALLRGSADRKALGDVFTLLEDRYKSIAQRKLTRRGYARWQASNGALDVVQDWSLRVLASAERYDTATRGGEAWCKKQLNWAISDWTRKNPIWGASIAVPINQAPVLGSADGTSHLDVPYALASAHLVMSAIIRLLNRIDSKDPTLSTVIDYLSEYHTKGLSRARKGRILAVAVISILDFSVAEAIPHIERGLAQTIRPATVSRWKAEGEREIAIHYLADVFFPDCETVHRDDATILAARLHIVVRKVLAQVPSVKRLALNLNVPHAWVRRYLSSLAGFPAEDALKQLSTALIERLLHKTIDSNEAIKLVKQLSHVLGNINAAVAPIIPTGSTDQLKLSAFAILVGCRRAFWLRRLVDDQHHNKTLAEPLLAIGVSMTESVATDFRIKYAASHPTVCQRVAKLTPVFREFGHLSGASAALSIEGSILLPILEGATLQPTLQLAEGFLLRVCGDWACHGNATKAIRLLHWLRINYLLFDAARTAEKDAKASTHPRAAALRAAASSLKGDGAALLNAALILDDSRHFSTYIADISKQVSSASGIDANLAQFLHVCKGAPGSACTHYAIDTIAHLGWLKGTWSTVVDNLRRLIPATHRRYNDCFNACLCVRMLRHARRAAISRIAPASVIPLLSDLDSLSRNRADLASLWNHPEGKVWFALPFEQRRCLVARYSAQKQRT